MDGIGALLIVVGLVVIASGLLMRAGGAFRPGGMPGDIRARRGPVTFYAPLGTSLVLSILLTIALNAAFCGALR